MATQEDEQGAKSNRAVTFAELLAKLAAAEEREAKATAKVTALEEEVARVAASVPAPLSASGTITINHKGEGVTD